MSWVQDKQNLNEFHAVHRSMTSQVTHIAGYQFKAVPDVDTLRGQMLTLCAQTHIRGSVLISPEGINLSLAGIHTDIDFIQEQLNSTCGFGQLVLNTTYTRSAPYRRLLVKTREELVPAKALLEAPGTDLSDFAGPAYITSERLKQWLDTEQEMVLLDLRNSFEYELGTFDDAIHLGLRHFRQLESARGRLEELPKDKPVVTFCTGGIRCEKGAPYVARQGFEQVYKLKGGILDYLGKFNDYGWHGDCFVFDERVALDSRLEPTYSRLCSSCQCMLNTDEAQFCAACSRPGADGMHPNGTG